MQFLKYRTNLHEPYNIYSWWLNKTACLQLDKKYVLWNSENFELVDNELVYDPFFVYADDKNNIDLNLKSDSIESYILVFDSLEEIKQFKQTKAWAEFKNKDYCKIRRIFILPKTPEQYQSDINLLKEIGGNISECGYTLFELLTQIWQEKIDVKVSEVLKSKKEIKRLIESGAVKIYLNNGWVKKQNQNEYFLPGQELIFKIGKTTFFKIK